FWMNRGLSGLSDFVEALGNAISKLSVDVLNALPRLGDFVNTLKSLALTLKGFGDEGISQMNKGLAGLSTFVEALVSSLSRLNDKLVGYMGKFAAFIRALKDLAVAMAGLTAGPYFAMSWGLGRIEEFVNSLVDSLNRLSDKARKSLEDLAKVMSAAATLAKATGADIGGLAVSLVLIE